MRIQNLSPLFLLLLLVSPILIASIPYAYSNEPVESTVSNMFSKPDARGIDPTSDVIQFDGNRYWLFFCDGLALKFTSSEAGGSGRIWRASENVSLLNNGDCDTGGFQYNVYYNTTGFHVVWRENLANSTFQYMFLQQDPLQLDRLEKLRQEEITTDGGAVAHIVESGNGNLYAITRFNTVTDDLHLYRSIDFGSTWTEITSIGLIPQGNNRLDITEMSSQRAMIVYEDGTEHNFRIFYGVNSSIGTEGTIQTGVTSATSTIHITTDDNGLIHASLKGTITGSQRLNYANFTGLGPDWSTPFQIEAVSSLLTNFTSGITINSNGIGVTVFNALNGNLRFAIQNQLGSFENGTEVHDTWTQTLTDTNFWSFARRANSTGDLPMTWVNNTASVVDSGDISAIQFHVFNIAQPPPPPPPNGEPIPAPPNPFGVGNETIFLTMIVEDSLGNLRINYAQGETMIFDISLQFVNSTTGGVQDGPVGSVINLFRFDEFFMAFTLVSSAPTIDRFNGLGPRARIPIVHLDRLQPTTEYRANFTGNFFFNITAGISNTQTIITIPDDEIPLSIGTRLSPPSVEGIRFSENFLGPLLPSDIQRQELFSHNEFFRVSTFLFRTDTGGILTEQTVFLEIQINATGPFLRLETITTNEAGRATSQFRTWDTRFVGAQILRFRYFASPPFANSDSINATVFISSEASDFRLTLEIIPSTVRTGDRIELRGQLTNIGSSSIGIPLGNRKIEIFVSSFDKTGFFNLQVTQNLALNIRTNEQGFYTHIIFGPNIGGSNLETMDFFSNSTINDLVATSPNATLTITVSTPPPQEIADIAPPNFFVFSALIDNPQANCQFSEPKVCSTMLWMTIVFLVSSVLAMMAGGLKIPGSLVGLGWLFMMLGGMIIGVFVQAVLEILLFIGALPVVVVLFISISAILRGGSSGVTTA